MQIHTDVKQMTGGYKYAQILPDIDLIISAHCNESIKVAKDLLKNAARLKSCNKKVGANHK